MNELQNIKKYLIISGFPMRKYNVDYIAESILVLNKDPRINMQKLYKIVADNNNTSVSSVERVINYSIKNDWCNTTFCEYTKKTTVSVALHLINLLYSCANKQDIK